jgi:hypothetical protein
MTPEEAKQFYEECGSIRAASRASGIPRTTFRRLLKKSDTTGISHKPTRRPEPILVEAKRNNDECINLFLPDIHSPYESKDALSIAIRHAKEKYDISNVILGGDFVDFWQVSRFTKNPRERMTLSEEIDYSVELLKQLQDIFPHSKFIYIKGNHEERLEKYLMNNAPGIIGMKGTTVQEQLKLKELGIDFIDNMKLLEETGKPFCVGQLFYIHGHEISGGGVNVARSKFLKVNENILFGHHHQHMTYAHKCFSAVKAAWSVGCLCTTSPEYLPVNNHLQGFAIVEHFKDKTFRVHNKLIIDGKVH